MIIVYTFIGGLVLFSFAIIYAACVGNGRRAEANPHLAERPMSDLDTPPYWFPADDELEVIPWD